MNLNDQVKNEATSAIEEFGSYIKEEEERIRLIGEEENERLINVLRQKGENVSCPLCLEDIQAIAPLHVSAVMICCGTRLCKNCGDDWKRKQDYQSTTPICFSCHRPVNLKSLKESETSDDTNAKAFALSFLGNMYRGGMLGVKRNLERSLRYFERAAALGDSGALSTLASVYFEGAFCGVNKKKSIGKARELAEKAVFQGNNASYALLGSIIEEEEGRNEISFRCYSISAYQGSEPAGMRRLGKFYEEKWSNLFYAESFKSVYNGVAVETRKNLILATYWYGKALEHRPGVSIESDLQICGRFTINFDSAMLLLWHRESLRTGLNPLTGYSHLPFVNCMINTIAENPNAGLKENIHFLTRDNAYWKEICAQCGKDENNNVIGQPIQQSRRNCTIKLKSCARCKAFLYCSKECQIKHWKAGHKVDCKGHWMERFFPDIRSPKKYAGSSMVVSFR